MEKLLTAFVVIILILPVLALPQDQQCLEAEKKKCFLDRDEEKCKKETSLNARLRSLKSSTAATRRLPHAKAQQPVIRKNNITGKPSQLRDIVPGARAKRTFRTEINLAPDALLRTVAANSKSLEASFADTPFISDPYLLDIPVGTRVEVFGHGRGERPLRIIIKESNYDDVGGYTDVVPIKVFEDREIRPQSPPTRFTTTRPWILYEIQQLSASGEWQAISLPDRYPLEVGRGTPRGRSTLLLQPIIPGAQDEPVLVFKWGGVVQPISRYIAGERTVTIFSRDVFDILLRGVQSRTSDEIIAEVVKCRNNGPFEDIDNVTSSHTYEIVGNNQIAYKYRWRYEDLLKNPPPFGGCDCDLGVDVYLDLRVNGAGDVWVSREPIKAFDVFLRCPACPVHTLAAVSGQLMQFLSFRYLLDEQEFYGFGEMKRAIEQNVPLVLQTGLGSVPVNATVITSARARVKRLWIEDGALKVTIEYMIYYRT